MLEIKGISKSFIHRGLVLDNLNMKVSEADAVSVMGPSGSGKTTLLNIIGLLDRPDSGDLIFRNRSLLDYGSDESALYRNKNVGFIFQDHLLLPYLTVRENILLPVLASEVSDEEYSEKTSWAATLMERTGITDIASKYPFQISGGEAQRATLVRSLVNKPSILLADEPTGSLDSKNADTLGDLLVEMNRVYGVTLIVATHSSELARKMSLMLELRNGKLFPSDPGK